MNKEVFNRVVAAVITLLLSGNIYFVKRQLDRMDSMEMITFSLRQEVAVLSARFDTMIAAHKENR